MADWDAARIREIWDRLAEAWDRNRAQLWSWTLPVSEHLVDRLDPKPGQTVLEVGTGPGDTGFLIAPMLEPGGRLICTDLSAEMLERARDAAQQRGLDNIEFRQMDVMALDLPAGTVDGVVGRLVYHLVPDPERAFREARRVLKPNGRLALTVFGPAHEVPYDFAVGMTMQRLGLSLPPGITIDVELNDADLIRDVLVRAGFDTVAVEEVRFTVRFPGPDAAWRYLTEMYGRSADLIRSLDPETHERFRDTFINELEPYKSPDGYAIPTLCLNVTAE
jgi:ubiquinone/menaquinone biosynthesis C-methylase UbiE